MMYGGPDTSIADEKSREIYNPNTEMKTLVLWGTDSSNSSPATGGNAIVRLRAKGVRTIVIDPRFVPEAMRADVWLPIRPGTDVALMLCWIRYIMATSSTTKTSSCVGPICRIWSTPRRR